MSKIVLDTSVIIEYIDKKADYHQQAKTIFNTITQGKLEAIIPHPTLTETYYVAKKIYKTLKTKNPQQKAKKLIEWLYRHSQIQIKGLNLQLALEAGKIKLKYNIALTDCYVIASTKIYNAKAIFKKREKELQNKITNIQKEYPIIFLEDYA
ncbi:MAG: PIN domain-containing protein [archaeon GB-1867-035]|nr:PIN domain-containing protein [Candidatus Culexmicrobium profundum]